MKYCRTIRSIVHNVIPIYRYVREIAGLQFYIRRVEIIILYRYGFIVILVARLKIQTLLSRLFRPIHVFVCSVLEQNLHILVRSNRIEIIC